MTHHLPIKFSGFTGCGLLVFVLALAGCNREQIKIQEVPKEVDQTAQMPMTAQVAESANGSGMPANPHAGMDMGGGAPTPASLKWTLPSGWKEKALSQMRVGSFDAPGKDGTSADVSIIPLPTAGPQTELPYYNMWRSELQLEPAEKVSSEPVTIGPGQGKLYEIADGKTAGRIIVAALDQGGMSWFFKIRGDDAVVRDQKPGFLQFLKSISFDAATANPHATMPMMATAPADASTAVAPSDVGTPVPAGWKEIPNPQMLLKKYVVQGSGDARADVNISMLAGTGGGVMMNVTRWRGQLGLQAMSEEDFSKQAQTIDVGGAKGTLVDMTGVDARTGKKTRLIGVIAPQGESTWFYKLMGDEQIVEQQKDAFKKFIQTAKFGN